jgi:hypothetical protein
LTPGQVSCAEPWCRYDFLDLASGHPT